MNLSSHLGDEIVFFGKIGESSCFVDGMCQWLLAIDMLLHPHGHRGSGGVTMIGCADQNGINLAFFFFQHDSEVAIFASVRIILTGAVEKVRIDVTERDDVFCLTAVNVGECAILGSDGSDVQFFVRGATGFDGSRIDKQGRCSEGGRGGNKIATCLLMSHDEVPVRCESFASRTLTSAGGIVVGQNVAKFVIIICTATNQRSQIFSEG